MQTSYSFKDCDLHVGAEDLLAHTRSDGGAQGVVVVRDERASSDAAGHRHEGRLIDGRRSIRDHHETVGASLAKLHRNADCVSVGESESRQNTLIHVIPQFT